MTADLFRKDYRQLKAQGVEMTPEDIVRLNALAVKVRLSRNAARTVHLPRLAFLPRDSWWRAPLVLREPTIAHELWIEAAARWIDMSDDRNFLWLHGYALAHRAEKLADAFSPKKLVNAVYRFAARRLSGFTHEQLSAAVEYCLFGANWTVGERGPDLPRKGGKAAAEDPGADGTLPSPTIGLLVDAGAMRLPLSIADAKGMTASELEEVIVRARMRDDDYDGEAAWKRAFAEYVRARNEIRARKAPTEATASADRPDEKTIRSK